MKDVHIMTRLELEIELLERRLEIQKLNNEIKSKDIYIEKYNNFYNKLMENDNLMKRVLKRNE